MFQLSAVSRKQSLCLLLLGLMVWPLDCAQAQAQRAELSSRRQPKRARVILAALRGATIQRVREYVASGVLPSDGALAQLMKSAVRAEKLLPIDGALTAPSAASLLTGAYPDKHGIVGNVFHKQGASLATGTSGFVEPLQAETLWEAALRQGKQVINLYSILPGGSSRARPGDRTFLTGDQLSSGKVVSLKPLDSAAWRLGEERYERVRPLAGEVRIEPRDEAVITLHALAVDTVFDGEERFDALVLDDDRNLQNGYIARLRANEWRALELPPSPGRAGLWMKLLSLSADLQEARLYLAPAYRNQGRPAGFLARAERESGFWPGFLDLTSFTQGLIDEQTLLEQGERLANFKLDAALACLRQLDFDLLLYDENVIDNVSHQFWPTHPQHANNPAERLRYARHVEWSYRLADRNLRQLMNAAPKGTTFVVVSPHGMTATHTAVGVNSILARAGLHVADDDAAEVRAFAYGPIAHLRVNLQGREPGGVVSPDQLQRYLHRIVVACRAARDPATGLPVFDRILTGETLRSVRMGNALTAGDVLLLARPGFVLSSQSQSPALRPRFFGDHGYLNVYREGHGFLLIAGPGLRSRELKRARTVDIAPTVSALLGIAPPAQSEGVNLLKTRL